MRVLIHLESPHLTFRITPLQLDRLRANLPEHELVRVTSEEELLDGLVSANAVVAWKFEAEWYARAPHLSTVFTPSAGKELIAADPTGRVATRFGTFHGPIMAESLLGMILFNNRRFDVALQAQAQHRWDRSPFEGTVGLSEQVVLIIGLGAIGRHCARLLRACGATVHGLRRDSSAAAIAASPDVQRVFAPNELLEALTHAAHVVCILPSDTGTDGIIGRAALAAMRRDAYLYNLGRGNAIDTEALADALRSGRIRGAFLDVVPEEPLSWSSPLWSVPNLHLTPHASAMRSDYLDRYFDELCTHLSAETRPG